MKELLTASRMAKMLACPRAHYWSYEVGLKPVKVSEALRLGSAWHRAMEARAAGKSLDECFMAAAPADGGEVDAVAANTLSGLMRGYWAYWGEKDDIAHQNFAEIEFKHDIPGSRSFVSAGKIDRFMTLVDGRYGMIEHKTTGESVEASSEYWLKLRFNPQVLQYVAAGRKLGWPIEVIFYDVVRKPSIAPKEIPCIDADGKKIVVDAAGNRVMKADGTPRESGDTAKGFTLRTKLETPEEFGDRLAADCVARPEFYFARREVPVTDQDLAEFESQRLMVSRMILSCRDQESRGRLARLDQAWPRNLGMGCQWCEYQSFCLQNINVDLERPPAGYAVKEKNEELTVK
jgi:hypothetical protein